MRPGAPCDTRGLPYSFLAEDAKVRDAKSEAVR
jgi:hypothetical protein